VDYAFEVIGRPEVVMQAFLATRTGWQGGGGRLVTGPTDMISVPGMLMSLAEKSPHRLALRLRQTWRATCPDS
jgi:hypothetical protein